MDKTVCFLLTVVMLLQSVNNANWQGTGNMSKDNMTVIWDYIHTNFDTSLTAQDLFLNGKKQQLFDFTVAFSDTLNSLWANQWNVLMTYSQGGYDTVLYGYAFRDHWMWYNGYKMNDGNSVTFVIWKDYNCIKLFTLVSVGEDQYISSYKDSSSLQTVLQGLFGSLSKDDIWKAAKKYADTLSANSAVQAALGSSDLAFSIVMTQQPGNLIFGRVCAKDYLVNYKKVDSNTHGKWGTALILQMR